MAAIHTQAYTLSMSRTWEQCVHLAMFTAAVTVIVALIVW